MEMMEERQPSWIFIICRSSPGSQRIRHKGCFAGAVWMRSSRPEGNPLSNCKHFYETHKDMRKVIPAVGLQGVYVCNEETCLGAKEFAESKDLPLNFHLSETRGEVNQHRKSTGMRPAEWLAHIGALSKNGIGAHSAWLTLKRSGCCEGRFLHIHVPRVEYEAGHRRCAPCGDDGER